MGTSHLIFIYSQFAFASLNTFKNIVCHLPYSMVHDKHTTI